MKINFVIPCLLGVEGIIADELRFLGAENVCAENGRVLFSGDENMLARVNICSHFAERVQINMGSFTAKTFEELFQGVKALPWEEWIGKLDAFPVKGYSLNSKLFSVSDCQAIIKKAVVEKLKQKYNVSWFDENIGDIAQNIAVSIGEVLGVKADSTPLTAIGIVNSPAGYATIRKTPSPTAKILSSLIKTFPMKAAFPVPS